MVTPDRKVRKLMEEYQKTGKLWKAALRADMDPKTARKYLRSGKLPSQMKVPHTWRTRPDPFEKYWAEAEAMLADAPELEAKALFEWLSERRPDVYQEGRLRTFQRRVRRWRALNGPPKEVYFPQEHEPGHRLSTDFTWMNSLRITINGEQFDHLLCHCVLSYSNWQWATVCHSESLLALRKGLQATLVRLGHVPGQNWTDHSTAATHVIGSGKDGTWEFNQSYLEMMKHFGIEPRTIAVGKPHENGDVESANGVLKRRLEQHLLLRGHRDFGSVEEYIVFLEGVLGQANRRRTKRLAEEMAVMRVLDVGLLPEYTEEEPRVTSWSTINVCGNPYSVPSRLIGEKVKARCYEDRVEVYYHGVHQLTADRVRGDGNHAINYRHVIDWLLRKPGAFRHYRYREDMFPTLRFRWAYDALCEVCSERSADMEYLRILHHAAQTMETTVDKALAMLKASGIVPRWSAVIEFAGVSRPQLPEMAPLVVDLTSYDHLLGCGEVVV
jgi:transposase